MTKTNGSHCWSSQAWRQGATSLSLLLRRELSPVRHWVRASGW